jgi:hypothetical protein
LKLFNELSRHFVDLVEIMHLHAALINDRLHFQKFVSELPGLQFEALNKPILIFNALLGFS